MSFRGRPRLSIGTLRLKSLAKLEPLRESDQQTWDTGSEGQIPSRLGCRSQDWRSGYERAGLGV
jgi:hypothetical protein